MADQPKYKPLDPSDFFLDGTSARPPVANTVARGYLRDDTELFSGKTAQGAEVTTFPFAIARSDLDRGRERFDIYCAPCHGRTGAGNGVVVQRGFSPPPTFHSTVLRGAPVGHFFDVITNGFGAMPDYRTQIPARDRWDIIAYIRALQLSENAPVTVVPPSIRERLATSETPIVENTPTPGPTR
jgi:mono/diheme cytochrome c family protein